MVTLSEFAGRLIDLGESGGAGRVYVNCYQRSIYFSTPSVDGGLEFFFYKDTIEALPRKSKKAKRPFRTYGCFADAEALLDEIAAEVCEANEAKGGTP